MKGQKKRKLPQIFRIGRNYILWLIALAIITASVFTFRFAQDATSLKNTLPNLITATSIISAILFAYLLMRLTLYRTIRERRLNRFVELQSELQPYREAFYDLATVLSRIYNIDLRWKQDFDSLLHDYDFMKDEAQKPNGVRFIRTLFRIGEQHWDLGDFEVSRKVITNTELNTIYDCLCDLSSCLGRYKHYKYVFKDLGIKFDDTSENVIFASDEWGIWLLKHENKLGKEPGKKWNTFTFWEYKINEAISIVEKMLANADEAIDIFKRPISTLYMVLVLALFFGLILPLVILYHTFSDTISIYLSYSSLIGFIISLLFVVNTIYKEMSSKKV